MSETIDITPRWEDVLGVLLVLIADGSESGKQAARSELKVMAKMADRYAALQKEGVV